MDFGRETPKFWFVRVGFWQNRFLADFYFWAAGFLRGFCRRIFSPHFCGKKCPEKSSRKIPGKILQNLHNKNPRHISAEGPGQDLNFAGWIVFLLLLPRKKAPNPPKNPPQNSPENLFGKIPLGFLQEPSLEYFKITYVKNYVQNLRN